MDISAACGAYVADDDVQQAVDTVKQKAEIRARELLPGLGENQSISFEISQKSKLYVGSVFSQEIYSFGSGTLHFQAASCTLSRGCGRCATLACGLGVGARDYFQDPYLIHIPFVGTNFWFGLKCQAGAFTSTVCSP
jgi:hypothetical protein